MSCFWHRLTYRYSACLIEIIGIFTALFAVRSANPIVALLYLIGTFITVIGLLILNHSEFLGYLFLIIYIGAIAILFLFVIMMFNLKKTTSQRPVIMSSLLFLLLFFKFNFVVHTVFFERYLNPAYTPDSLAILQYVKYSFADILAFSKLLYTEHSYLFIETGLLLLIAMLGAIVLAMGAAEKSNTHH